MIDQKAPKMPYNAFFRAGRVVVADRGPVGFLGQTRPVGFFGVAAEVA